MSCENEWKRRHTYNYAVDMAKKALSLVNDNVVVYKFQNEENVYDFCCETEYTNAKGKKIITLDNPRKNNSI